MTIRIGTRKSRLAMWQAEYVAEELNNRGINVELIPIETRGDKVLDVSIAKIGSKGVFTEELEQMLENGEIDIAVHSAKDLQSELPAGFEILAFSEREKENDVLISHDKSLKIHAEGEAFTVGTSSTRRVAMLAHYFPQIEVVEVRGNLQTRIRKMEEGHCQALLLAYAGVARMGYDELINQELPLDIFTPAVGQGSMAIEIASILPDEKRYAVREAINHRETELKLMAERAYLRKLQGGCSIPAFANAKMRDGHLVLQAGIFNLDGQKFVRQSASGPMDDPVVIGENLGEKILSMGGKEILDQIREELDI